MTQVRLQKTQEVEKVLETLQKRYALLSEAEIIKLALSEKYNQIKNEDGQNLRIYTSEQAKKMIQQDELGSNLAESTRQYWTSKLQ
jgi:hypothetical protein